MFAQFVGLYIYHREFEWSSIDTICFRYKIVGICKIFENMKNLKLYEIYLYEEICYIYI